MNGIVSFTRLHFVIYVYEPAISLSRCPVILIFMLVVCFLHSYRSVDIHCFFFVGLCVPCLHTEQFTIWHEIMWYAFTARNGYSVLIVWMANQWLFAWLIQLLRCESFWCLMGTVRFTYYISCVDYIVCRHFLFRQQQPLQAQNYPKIDVTAASTATRERDSPNKNVSLSERDISRLRCLNPCENISRKFKAIVGFCTDTSLCCV